MGARVTIGMPVYNSAATLERAVASVIAQTFTDWTLVITDDRSTDRTVAIATALAATDHRITVHENSVRRVYGNFETALRGADTPYFVWLAGDDFWDPAFLEVTVMALDGAPAAVSAIPDAAFITDPPRPIPNLAFLRGKTSQRIKHYLAHPGGTRMYGLMRTPVAQAAFPKKTSHAYDWYFMVSVLSQGPQLSIPQTLLFREETDWIAYARAGKSDNGRGVFRRWPVLQTSMMLLRDRRLPLRAFPALVALNLRKHEEYVAVNAPQVFARRQSMYRRIGLPIANSAEKLDALASLNSPDARSLLDLSRAATPVIGRADPQVTAVLTCRNAEKMLPAYLSHSAALGHRVVIIDHGSTDATRTIAQSHLHQTVQTVIDTPFCGSFDLSAQLELKQQVFSTLQTDWVIHADVDEFLQPPEGKTLADLIRHTDAAAVACTEFLYLPRHEDEMHDPARFRETLQHPFRMLERDQKQRLFRRDAPLDVWFATGGHTVTRLAGQTAPDRLRLSHYLGLSLDEIRGQYYSQVFAPRDLAKLWHGNRMAAKNVDICATAACGDAPVTALPIFRQAQIPSPSPIENADIVLLGHASAALGMVAKHLAALFPGLRLHLTTDWSGPETHLPILHCLSHPAMIHQGQNTRNDERQQAAQWTRRLANARQKALAGGTAYAEIRTEDLTATAQDLAACVKNLMLGPATRHRPVFVEKPAPLRQQPYAAPVLTITRPLAAELGYL